MARGLAVEVEAVEAEDVDEALEEDEGVRTRTTYRSQPCSATQEGEASARRRAHACERAGARGGNDNGGSWTVASPTQAGASEERSRPRRYKAPWLCAWRRSVCTGAGVRGISPSACDRRACSHGPHKTYDALCSAATSECIEHAPRVMAACTRAHAARDELWPAAMTLPPATRRAPCLISREDWRASTAARWKNLSTFIGVRKRAMRETR